MCGEKREGVKERAGERDESFTSTTPREPFPPGCSISSQNDGPGAAAPISHPGVSRAFCLIWRVGGRVVVEGKAADCVAGAGRGKEKMPIIKARSWKEEDGGLQRSPEKKKKSCS